MRISNTEVYGFDSAFRGMRNPMNSWELNDTQEGCVLEGEYVNIGVHVGENDMKLARKLINSGNEHCKFLRQIQVWADIDMPRYWWSEFDTYKFNSKNSCSTMHKLFNKDREIQISDFVFCEEDLDILELVVKRLNELRLLYLESKDTNYLIRGKMLLCEGFEQLRTVNTNYAELRTIYHQRKNHRLKEEWVYVFCDWVEGLPYAKQLIIE